MANATYKFFCLNEELDSSHTLLLTGFGCLQQIDMSNAFYHLPHQLLASGMERLMKCYIALVYRGRHNQYPTKGFMQTLGHDLLELHKEICDKYYGGTTRPLVNSELDYLKNDATLNECIRILSLFGRFGRYYNLDVIAGGKHQPIDPKSEWEKLERTVVDVTPYLADQDLLDREYYPKVHSRIIAALEHYLRAIALQFTIGDHVDDLNYLQILSSVYSTFRNVDDSKFGTADYRKYVPFRRNETYNWAKRTEAEVVKSGSPYKIFNKHEFDGDWPFRTERVIVEFREKLFCILNTEGYDFALNGAAATRFRLPPLHESEIAILGKSVGPFIEAARSL